MENRIFNDTRDKVLLVSHKEKKCGVYQYGISISEALKISQKYAFVYAECSSEGELFDLLDQIQPSAIIYNYHPQTMSWMSKGLKDQITIPQIGTIHEVTQKVADEANKDLFDYHIAPDPTLNLNNPIVFKTGRLVPLYKNNYDLPKIVTIGSFGFATGGKGFEKLIIAVQDEFDEAIIRLHMPVGDFANLDVEKLVERCKQLVVKKKIELIISHSFLEKNQLLDFLAQNTINVFLYDQCQDRGISSVIDYALAVQRPIAISNSNMFRHIFLKKSFLNNHSPVFIEVNDENIRLSFLKRIFLKVYLTPKNIFYSRIFKGRIPRTWLWFKKRTSLIEIINNGNKHIERFCSEWSPANLIMDYERILDKVLGKLPKDIKCGLSFIEKSNLMSVGVSDVKIFNRILDSSARKQYSKTVEELAQLAPDFIARKIPEANVQQAFVLDTVRKFVSQIFNPKILCIGSFEDTAAISLKKLNYQIEEVDPIINYDLSTFFHKQSTIQESYNIIFSTSVLEHIENDELFINQIVRLLALGGIAILTFDYNDQYQLGDEIPNENYRLYTQKDLNDRIFPLLKGCCLVDEPQWDCPNPDFVYAGKYRYTFSTLVFQKNNL